MYMEDGRPISPKEARQTPTIRLLRIRGGCRVGLEHGNVLHPNPAAGHYTELCVCLIKKIFRKIFGRWIQRRERLQIVNHPVVETIGYVLYNFTQIFEVKK